MGGLAALRLVFEKSLFVSRLVKGVIVEAPWISNSIQRTSSLIEGVLCMVLAKCLPNVPISTGDKQFGADVDPRFAQKALRSPLFSPCATPRLLDSAFRSMTFVRKHFTDWPRDLPGLFLQGTEDDFVDCATNIAWFEEVRECAGKEIIDYRVYPGASHSLLKTDARKWVLSDILQFVQCHV
jgi:alpha-beta hydrolase superfamily lysophospholipase